MSTREELEASLQNANEIAQSIRTLLQVGGSSRYDKVRRSLSMLHPNGEYTMDAMRELGHIMVKNGQIISVSSRL